MKHLYLIPVVSVIVFSSCEKNHESVGSGPIITEQRSVNNFSAIQATEFARAIIQHGPQCSVTITGPSDLIPFYVAKVKNGVLSLYFPKYLSDKVFDLSVVVTLPVLQSASVADLSILTVADNFSGDDVQLTCSGWDGAWIGFSHATIKNLSVSISGGGRVEGFNIVANKATISLTDGGLVELSCQDELNAKIVGSGRVYYWGNPKVSQEITGTGAVIRSGP